MERDSRRDHGEWRGCHNFDKIICDGDLPASSERRGGLKMGQRYYYYYEVDGSTEIHNPSLPTTTTCPFLPGQAVNTLDVPLERRTRLKSASMNSLRNTDYKTMDPVDRFTTPRPPLIPGHRREFRIASASSILPKRVTRSVSPAPSWTGTARRFLGFKLRDREAERGRKSALSEQEDAFVEEPEPSTETRSVTPSGSIRSRELSPESLRRFLSDDLPSAAANTELAPGFSIPDDIEEEIEDNDDDDNFASATTTDNTSSTTPSHLPFRQGGLSAPPASHSRITTVSPSIDPVSNSDVSLAIEPRSKVTPTKLDIPRSYSTVSMASSSLASAASPISNISQGLSQFSFFDDSDDDDEDLASYEANQTLLGSGKQNDSEDKEASDVGPRAPITSYSLPRASTDSKLHVNTSGALASLESPLMARTDNGMSVDRFGLPSVEIGLDLNWVIRPKEI
ncbi:hypothetical protein GQX73_g8601 [Xylaria multiplex]|uniref:Uncharacterized protein n=1 Tax=Xylaria multiplex TaxID=323545 RepID=A0A7C8MPV1_9PEZI|nr:hypothetical protein GQX73_g8601 [Xylaria multiplex]